MSECWIAALRAVPKEVTGRLDGGKEHGTAGVNSLGSVIVVVELESVVENKELPVLTV